MDCCARRYKETEPQEAAEGRDRQPERGRRAAGARARLARGVAAAPQARGVPRRAPPAGHAQRRGRDDAHLGGPRGHRHRAARPPEEALARDQAGQGHQGRQAHTAPRPRPAAAPSWTHAGLLLIQSSGSECFTLFYFS